MSLTRSAFAFAFLCATAPAAQACPSDYDLDFGDAGAAISVDTTNIPVYTYDSVMAGDGSILVAGSFNRKATVLRYTPDGHMDTTFGEDGLAQLGVDGKFTSIALQDDGKIVVSIDSFVWNYYTSGVARFDADGRPDEDFGSAGLARLDRHRTTHGRQVLVRSDGVIVLAGEEDLGGLPKAHLYFFSADGGFDPPPGDGVLQLVVNSAYDFATSLVEVEGKALMVCGNLVGPYDNETFVTRVTAGGEIDTGFGVAGTRRFPSPGFHEDARHIDKDGDGRLYVSGNTSPVTRPARARISVRRLFPNGDVDESYGVRGGTIQFGFGRNLSARGLAVEDDGRVTVPAGFLRPRLGSVIARLTPNGRRDRTFGRRGVRRVNSRPNTYLHGVVVQDDGKIVANGWDSLGPLVIRLEGGDWDGEEACIVGCGDGEIRSGETCDDGNVLNGDGCSAACLVE